MPREVIEFAHWRRYLRKAGESGLVKAEHSPFLDAVFSYELSPGQYEWRHRDAVLIVARTLRVAHWIAAISDMRAEERDRGSEQGEKTWPAMGFGGSEELQELLHTETLFGAMWGHLPLISDPETTRDMTDFLLGVNEEIENEVEQVSTEEE